MDKALPIFTVVTIAATGSANILSHVTDCRYFIPEKKMEFVNEMMEVMAKSVIKYEPIAIAEPVIMRQKKIYCGLVL